MLFKSTRPYIIAFALLLFTSLPSLSSYLKIEDKEDVERVYNNLHRFYVEHNLEIETILSDSSIEIKKNAFDDLLKSNNGLVKEIKNSRKNALNYIKSSTDVLEEQSKDIDVSVKETCCNIFSILKYIINTHEKYISPSN